MQYKYFLRTFGVPNPEYGVRPVEEVEEELRSKYTSQGWLIESTQFLGATKNREGNDIGYRIFHVLMREEQPVTVREAKVK